MATIQVSIDDKDADSFFIPNAELREAMEDIRLDRNLYGPFTTAADAVRSMLEDDSQF